MERIKPHIIKAKLYADGRVEWVSVEDGTSPQLNVHQKARQYLRVELADFVLDRESGEGLSVAFEQGENKVNRSAMAKQENGIYQIAIPSLVSNTPGVWVTQFFIEQYDIIIPSHVTEFTEYASIVDDGNTMVDEALLQSMFDDILIIKNSAERNIEEAVKDGKGELIEVSAEAKTARDEVVSSLESIANGLQVVSTVYVGEVENGFEYQLTFSNGSKVNVVAPHGKIKVEWWI